MPLTIEEEAELKKKKLEGEEQEEDDAEDGESTDDEGKEESGKKPEGEDKQETVEDTEKSPEEIEAEAERTAIRERRKREKKMKRERENRERFNQQKTIIDLQSTVAEQAKVIKQVQGTLVEGDTQRIDAELRELTTVYNDAQAKMEAAITGNDGATWRKAKEISDKAFARYNLLELTKRQRSGTAKSTTGTNRNSTADSPRNTERTSSGQPQGIVLGESAIDYGRDWQKKNSWYKSNEHGQPLNFDSRVVQMIDKDLYDEGYDPESQEYWDELSDRVKERMPYLNKGQAGKKPTRVTTTGGGGDSGTNSTIEKSLPKEFMEQLKAAGYENDQKKKQAAIKDYLKNRKKG